MSGYPPPPPGAYGQPQAPRPAYGQPQAPRPAYGAPPGQAPGGYAQPAAPRGYAQPGAPAAPRQQFGAAPAAPRGYAQPGAPQAPRPAYGAPAAPRGYAQPAAPAAPRQQFGAAPAAPRQQFGTPAPRSYAPPAARPPAAPAAPRGLAPPATAPARGPPMGAPRPPMGAAPARGPPMGAAPPMSAPPARGPQAAFHQVPARAAQPPTAQFGQMRVADGAPPPPGPPRGPPSRSGSMVSAPSQQAPKTFQGYAPAAEGGYVPTAPGGAAAPPGAAQPSRSRADILASPRGSMSQPALPAAPMSMPAPRVTRVRTPCAIDAPAAPARITGRQPPRHRRDGVQRRQVEIDESSQCDGRYMRCSVKTLPSTAQVASASKLPLGVVCQPMALDSQQDAPLDVVNFGSTGIVRCKKCRAYVNPFVAWVNNGRQWRCNVCGFSNDVPNSYFCQLDERGRRRDRDQRPELSKGSVELVAPGEYMVRPPQPPVYVFAIDVSAPSVASGLVNVAASTIKKCLDQLPGAPRTQVAVVTYDSSVHFYNLKVSLKQPSMLTVPDLTDLFVPLPDDLLVNLAESRESIDMLLDSLPQMHASSPSPASCLGAALTAAYRVMGHVGGKLCVFQSQLPNCGEAALKNRENPRAYGTDGERMLLLAEQSKGKSPEQTTASWYETRAIEFSRLQIGVELFVAPPSNAYVDLATLALLPKITAGQLYYYPQFSHKKDSQKLEAELTRALTRPTGFEAVMRVRCTRGLRVSAFRGNYYVRGHDLLALPNCTPESVFALEIAHDAEAPLTAGAASVQASLLYTTSSGERRIRVHTLVLPTSPDVGVVAASADVDVVANLLAKASVEATLKAGLDAARSRLQQRCIDVVAACRHGRSSASVGGYGAPAVRGAPAAPQTPSQPPKLPESLQLLPLYCMALLKSAAFRGGADVRADERSYTLQRLDGMAPEQTRSFVYPRLFALHKLPPSQTPFQFPPPLNLSAESISSDGIYLLDDSLQLMVWVGGASDPKLCDSLFLQDPSDGRVMMKPDPGGDSPLSRACKVIAELRKTRPAYLALEIIREGDPNRQPVFFRHLVEDHASFPGGQYSYQEFMAHVSRHA